MFRWILIAGILALALADPGVEMAKPGPLAGSSEQFEETKALPLMEGVHRRDHDFKRDDYGEGLPGYGVVREIHPSGHPLPEQRIKEQNKIVYDRYSPTYYQPTWILDYRYLKTGGRDYTRGEGGQILILPKGVHLDPHDKEHKPHGNFDELLEFLRLQELAERERLRLERTRKPHHHHDHDDHENYGHDHPGITDRPLMYREDDFTIPMERERARGRSDMNMDEIIAKWEEESRRIQGKGGRRGGRKEQRHH